MKYFTYCKQFLEEKKLWEVFIYLFFGGLTTVVNMVVYFIALNFFQLNYLVANSISWVASVLFAFVTNKRWVFKSETATFKESALEFFKFIFYRIVSYGIDMGSMFLLISILFVNNFWAKLITQILVVLMNYLFSKFLIFKKVLFQEETLGK